MSVYKLITCLTNAKSGVVLAEDDVAPLNKRGMHTKQTT